MINVNKKIFPDEVEKALISADENMILTLGWYFSWNNFSELRDGLSIKIMDLKSKNVTQEWQKRKQLRAISDVVQFLEKILSLDKEITIVPIPSSKPNNENHGITKMARELAKRTNAQYNPKILERMKEICNLADGGSREESLHDESITVNASCCGKIILLIDDVMTTGNSMNVCKRKLLDAGAEKVYCLALGRTFSINYSNVHPSHAEYLFRERCKTIDDNFTWLIVANLTTAEKEFNKYLQGSSQRYAFFVPSPSTSQGYQPQEDICYVMR